VGLEVGLQVLAGLGTVGRMAHQDIYIYITESLIGLIYYKSIQLPL